MIERMKKIFGTRTSAEINALIADEKAKEFLTRAREVMQNKRSIVNAGLLIPEVWLGVIRENVERYSKLYGRVYVRTIKGTGRVIVAGSIPEAVWTECCAKLNEIALGFNAWEVDCYKTGAYIPVCNATLEDSDLNLAAEIMDAISIGIAMSLDKAIVWGRNIAANSKMPLGIVPSLAQTAQPADYPTTARPWVDLHTTNIVSITSTSGLALLKDLVKASAVAASKYSRGRITWILNEKTYKNVVAETLSVNAAGAVVSAVNGTMPVISGDFIVLDFLPDDVLIFGYLDNYLLADRQRVELGQSEHVQFIEDNTVFKGTARYDGAPVIREAFGVALLNGAELDLTDVTFPQDTANA